jgi:serine/threonine protein kinase
MTLIKSQSRKTKKRALLLKKKNTQKKRDKGKGKGNEKLKEKVGGEAIGHGGFGCAFRPSLKCKGVSQREPDRVSKLMKKKYAEKEYAEITRFLPELKKVPNYKRYYIIDDVTICEPDDIIEQDLVHFSSECKPMKKMGITKENITSRLDELMILNLPDGGVDVGDYMDSDTFRFDKLNNMLIELLLHGIVPMNRMSIYHGDIKESNILIGNDGYAKLIDWGLSSETDGESIPKSFSNKPFQYNIPFTAILLNETFTRMFEKFYAKQKKKKKRNEIMLEQMKAFVQTFIHKWIEERGDGHIKTLIKLIKLATGKKPMTVIVEYIAKVILHYGAEASEDWLMTYFRDIYLKNLDIWGLVTSYSPVLEETEDSHLKEIFSRFLYCPENPHEVMNVNDLVQALTKKDD